MYGAPCVWRLKIRGLIIEEKILIKDWSCSELCLKIEYLFQNVWISQHWRQKIENKPVNFDHLTLINEEIEDSFMYREPHARSLTILTSAVVGGTVVVEVVGTGVMVLVVVGWSVLIEASAQYKQQLSDSSGPEHSSAPSLFTTAAHVLTGHASLPQPVIGQFIWRCKQNVSTQPAWQIQVLIQLGHSILW